jgi:uncharacterized phage protein gp47/JayE
MSNYVDLTGLHTEQLTDIISGLESGFQSIYGSDINLDPQSPDSQMIALFSQAKIDILDVITQVYNSFSPSTATGVSLDQRSAINGVIRQGATYTRTPISIVTSTTVTLYGLDTQPTAPFTVADSNGNQFYLETTTTFSAGTTSANFRAATAGLISTSLNTITSIVTITLGVTSVNNPLSPIVTGVNEETDAELRARRQAAVSLPSVGFLTSLDGAIKQVSNVTDAVVYENVTSSTDAFSVPAHSIWAIVDGGTNADIADVIYRKRNAGCGMKGSVSVNVTEPNGSLLAINFDRPSDENLYIQLALTSTDPTHTIDTDYIKTQILDNIVLGIYKPADLSDLIALVKGLDSFSVFVSGGVSNTAGSYVSYKYPTDINYIWRLATARMYITQVY